jgi:hypothetical protein
MKAWNALAAIALSAVMSVSCSSERPIGSEAARERPTLPTAQGVDVRHPDRRAPVTLVVAPVDVPRRVRAGTRITAVFQARPDSSCQLEVFDEHGDSWERLPPAIADASGRVSWTWSTTDVDAGRVATAYVVCSGGQRGQATIAIT